MVNPLTIQQQRKTWTICRSLSGVTYYYNRATKKSQYQMPDCFKTTQQKLQHPEWKQYRTGEGKKFYYNARTTKSVWQLPAEVKEWRIKMLEQQRLEEENERRKEEEGLLDVNEVKRKKIKQLMKEKHIDATKKWDDCCSICKDDPRWDLITSMQDKKAIFGEFINQLRKTEDNQKKVKLDHLKANFLKMLKESTYLTSQSKFHKSTILFAGDQRWKDLDEDERQNVFQSYLDVLLSKQRQEAKQKRAYYMDQLGKEMEERQLHYKTKWDQFRQQYRQSRNIKNLSKIDQLSRFVEYILETQKKNQEHMQNEKINQERINRQNFRDMLITKMKEGGIDHKTRWAMFVRNNRHESALIEMMDPDQKGSSAHELFEDLMEGIRANHKSFKSLIKNHFKSTGYKITADVTQEEFEEKLKGLEQFSMLRPIIQDYFFYYFKNKLRAKGSSKKDKKDKKLLMKIFQSMREIKPNTRFYDILPKVKKQLDDHKVNEETIRKYFEKYVKQLETKKQTKRSRSSRDSSNSSDEDTRKRRKVESSERSQSSQSPKKRKSHRKESSSKNKDKKKMEVEKNPDYEEEGEIKDSDGEVKKKKSHKSKHKKKRKHSSDDSD